MAPPIDINRFEQLRATGELPSPRGVALAIIRLTQQEEVSIAELARVISGDPAFVGRVIKAANGVIGFNRRPLVSVHEALMVLGLPAVRSMALGFSLLSDYRTGGCKAFDYNGFWAFSLALALGMQLIGRRTRVAAPDELFSVGLLARVGELALATLYPDEYAEVLRTAGAAGSPDLLELEASAFAMTHAELGASMLTDWGLPAVFVDLIEYYDRPDEAGYVAGSRPHRLLEATQAARCFADMCVAAESARPHLLGRLLDRSASLGVDRADVLADCAPLYTLWGEWGRLLQIDMLASPPFPDLPTEPAAAASPAVDALRAAFSVGVNPLDDAGSGAGEVSPSGQDGDRVRVLVVDADAALAPAVASILVDQQEVEVLSADGVDAGLDLAVRLHPPLMVVGCGSQERAGLNLIQSLRRLRIGPPTYVLAVNDDDSEAAMVGAFEAGADDFVTRTAGARVLAVRLRAGLRNVRMQQALARDREELKRYAAELAVKNRQLREVALTDALTGFRNRRYAIDRMAQEWAAAERSARPLACMVIDLDGLKDINDAYGHDVGDIVLKRVAEALRGSLRGQDVICRTGGDEFLAICPGSALDAAIACAERLRVAVSGLDLDVQGQRVQVSISVGVAERDRNTADVAALLKLADRGAYRAKGSGRNRVAAIQRESVAADAPGRPTAGGTVARVTRG